MNESKIIEVARSMSISNLRLAITRSRQERPEITPILLNVWIDRESNKALPPLPHLESDDLLPVNPNFETNSFSGGGESLFLKGWGTEKMEVEEPNHPIDESYYNYIESLANANKSLENYRRAYHMARGAVFGTLMFGLTIGGCFGFWIAWEFLK